MTLGPSANDLIVLSADVTMREVLRALLGRHVELGCCPLSFRDDDLPVHPRRDPGIRNHSHEFLRPFHRQYRHALILCDLEGAGAKLLSRVQLERQIEERLNANGWAEGRAASIVLVPELEVWMWGDWRATEQAISWPDQGLRTWLIEESLLDEDELKPRDPKHALDRARKKIGKRNWSGIHTFIARSARFERCTDPAFLKLRATLQRWFPPTT